MRQRDLLSSNDEIASVPDPRQMELRPVLGMVRSSSSAFTREGTNCGNPGRAGERSGERTAGSPHFRIPGHQVPVENRGKCLLCRVHVQCTLLVLSSAVWDPASQERRTYCVYSTAMSISNGTPASCRYPASILMPSCTRTEANVR